MVELGSAATQTLQAINSARLDAYNKRRSSAINISEVGRKCATDCRRYLFLALRWPLVEEAPSAQMIRIFERGELEEERVIKDLEAAGVELDAFDPVTSFQYRAILADGFLRGKLDGIIRSGVPEAPSAEHVLEIKTAKASDWRAIVKHGLEEKKPEHYAQMQLYMTATGIKRALYVVVNKDTEELHVERFSHDKEYCDELIQRVRYAVRADAMPIGLSDGFTCKFCQFRPFCHENAAVEANCRTCAHSTFTTDAGLYCEKRGEPRGFTAQQGGCGMHLYNPYWIRGTITDVDDEAGTITYTMDDGTSWTDGAGDAEPC